MSTTAKFSLDNPYYAWPKNPEIDVQILINKLNDLRVKFLEKDSWNINVIIDPNSVLRKIESQDISVVFVCLNDLKHSVHVAHLPFLCRLTGTKLAVLKLGSASELQSYLGKNNLFMFAISKHSEMMNFAQQFPEMERFDLTILPQMSIRK